MVGALSVAVIDSNFGILLSCLSWSVTNSVVMSPWTMLIERSSGVIVYVVCVSGSGGNKGCSVVGPDVDSAARDVDGFVESVHRTGGWTVCYAAV